MNLFEHMYAIIRYGEWYAGWVMYDGKPMLGVYHDYYDGHHICLHVYKFYLGVYYL